MSDILEIMSTKEGLICFETILLYIAGLIIVFQSSKIAGLKDKLNKEKNKKSKYDSTRTIRFS